MMLTRRALAVTGGVTAALGTAALGYSVYKLRVAKPSGAVRAMAAGVSAPASSGYDWVRVRTLFEGREE